MGKYDRIDRKLYDRVLSQYEYVAYQSLLEIVDEIKKAEKCGILGLGSRKRMEEFLELGHKFENVINHNFPVLYEKQIKELGDEVEKFSSRHNTDDLIVSGHNRQRFLQTATNEQNVTYQMSTQSIFHRLQDISANLSHIRFAIDEHKLNNYSRLSYPYFLDRNPYITDRSIEFKGTMSAYLNVTLNPLMAARNSIIQNKSLLKTSSGSFIRVYSKLNEAILTLNKNLKYSYSPVLRGESLPLEMALKDIQVVKKYLNSLVKYVNTPDKRDPYADFTLNPERNKAEQEVVNKLKVQIEGELNLAQTNIQRGLDFSYSRSTPQFVKIEKEAAKEIAK